MRELSEIEKLHDNNCPDVGLGCNANDPETVLRCSVFKAMKAVWDAWEKGLTTGGIQKRNLVHTCGGFVSSMSSVEGWLGRTDLSEGKRLEEIRSEVKRMLDWVEAHPWTAVEVEVTE